MKLPVQINLTHKSESIRPFVEQLLSRCFGNETAAVRLPEDFSPRLSWNDDSCLIEWSETVEADLPGPFDPDMLSIRVFSDHADVKLRLGNLRINY